MTTELKLNWKKCSKCGSWKEQEIGYYKCNKSYCKKCHIKFVTKSRKKHRETYNNYKRQYAEKLRKNMTAEKREYLRFKSLEYYYMNKDAINKKRREQRRRLKREGL